MEPEYCMLCICTFVRVGCCMCALVATTFAASVAASATMMSVLLRLFCCAERSERDRVCICVFAGNIIVFIQIPHSWYSMYCMIQSFVVSYVLHRQSGALIVAGYQSACESEDVDFAHVDDVANVEHHRMSYIRQLGANESSSFIHHRSIVSFDSCMSQSFIYGILRG